MAKKQTVGEAKQKLTKLLKQLKYIDENNEFCVQLSDNHGDSYIENINEFNVRIGLDGIVYFENF